MNSHERRIARRKAERAAKVTAPILSSTDWCAFDLPASPYAPKMCGMARGLGGEIVYQWKPSLSMVLARGVDNRLGRVA